MNVLTPLLLHKAIEQVTTRGISGSHFAVHPHSYFSSFFTIVNQMFSHYCREVDVKSIHAQFSAIPESVLNSCFLTDGLCTGATIHAISRFFQTQSPLKSVPVPVKEEPVRIKGTEVFFYPLQPWNSTAEKETSHLRFLQAAYRVADSNHIGMTSEVEIFPRKLLNKHSLELVRQLPSEESGRESYPLEDLLSILKEVASQEDQEAAFLFAIHGDQNHHIALRLQAPYHFFDPAFGLATSDNKQQFLLFLENFLSEKYPDYSSFALLEFTPKSQGSCMTKGE